MTRASRLWALGIAAPVLIAATLHASWLAWLADDAFLTFRYARQLLAGAGWVFNPDERVEGFSHPLWAALVAVGMSLRVSPEVWTLTLGIASFAVAAILLTAMHLRARHATGLTYVGLPVAAVGAALHTEWATFATSGLETSLFATLVLGAFFLTVRAPRRPRRAQLAGVVLALACLTRHDGLVFAPLMVAWLVRRDVRARMALAACIAGFCLVYVPATVARVAYFGHFFPNPYFARSAHAAWWEQGFVYLGLFFQRNWLLGLAPLAMLAASLHGRRAGRANWVAWAEPGGWLALAWAAAYILYVAYVGGDFMYGRFVVPIVPLLFVALECATLVLGAPVGAAGSVAEDTARRRRSILTTASVGALLVAHSATPSPLGPDESVRGISDERAYYTSEVVSLLDFRGASVGAMFDNLPVHIAFFRGGARFVYRTHVDVAVDAAAGNTDAVVAHAPLPARGRPGHEKQASLDYLLEERRVHFVFQPVADVLLDLDRQIPHVTVSLNGVHARMLHWDPAVVGLLRLRDAIVPDYPALLDGTLQAAGTLSTEELQREFRKATRFYFQFVDDAPRRQAFEALLRVRTPAPVP